MAKTIYFNGDIITMEDSKAEAVLTDQGRILRVGGREEILALADEDTRLRDLEGHTLMPAFIDPHGHFINYATGLLQVSLEGCADFAELGGRIREFIEKNQVKAGDWVIGRDYDHNYLAEGRTPEKEVLDAAAPENPVLISHQSGHMGVLNSLALKRLGLTAQSPCPEGGRFGIRDGELTGYLEENAFMAARRQVPLNSIEELADAVIRTQEAYASYGITTAQEGMMVDEIADIYQYLVEQNLLKLDVVGYADMNGSERLLKIFGGSREYQGHFRLGGYKIFLDGSPQGHTAWMLTPYVNEEEGYRGYPTLTDEQVYERAKKAAEDGRQLLAHCNGDAAARQFIAAYKRVEEESPEAARLRPVMIHAQLVRTEDLKEVKDIGMIPSFFVAHVWHWGDIHIKSFGLERASQISPAVSAGKLGIPYTFHQDAPVIQPDMLETVWCAVNRLTKNGVKLGEDQCVSVLDALKAVTRNAARQYGEEESKGSIREGKRADLVILDRSPLKVPPMELRDIQVLETIKDGETIFRK